MGLLAQQASYEEPTNFREGTPWFDLNEMALKIRKDGAWVPYAQAVLVAEGYTLADFYNEYKSMGFSPEVRFNGTATGTSDSINLPATVSEAIAGKTGLKADVFINGVMVNPDNVEVSAGQINLLNSVQVNNGDEYAVIIRNVINPQQSLNDGTGGITEETDPVFSASDAAGITSTDVQNWNTAYGWGDHSQAGYLPLSGGTMSGSLSVDTIAGATGTYTRFGDVGIDGANGLEFSNGGDITGVGAINDNDYVAAVDPNARTLYGTDGTTPMVDWSGAGFVKLNGFINGAGNVAIGDTGIMMSGAIFDDPDVLETTKSIDPVARTLHDANGAAVLDWSCSSTDGYISISDIASPSTSNVAIGTGNRQLFASNGSTIMMDWSTTGSLKLCQDVYLQDLSGTYYDLYMGYESAIYDGTHKSIDPYYRKLFASDGETVVAEWGDGTLKDGLLGHTFVSDGATLSNGFYFGYSAYIYDASACFVIDPNSRVLYGSDGSSVMVDWTGVYNSGAALSFNGQHAVFGVEISDASGNYVIALTDRKLYDLTGSAVIDFSSASAPAFPGMTTDGFLKTSSSTGILAVDTSTYCRWRGADSTAPSDPNPGDIYLDTNFGSIKIYNGTTWQTIN